MQPAAFLCVICVICGRITSKLTQSIYIEETPISPADLADLRRQNPKQQNNNTQTNCLSLRDNAACCIPLRDLRYLRENIHMRVLNQTTQKKPQYLPQISQIYADEPRNHKTTLTSPNCLSLRNNAACCIPLRNLRYLRENTRKSTQSIGKEETPMSPADLADLRRQNHKTTLTTKPKTA